MGFCEQILKLDPLDGKTMLLLARLQQNEGLLERAINTCEHAKRLKDHKADAFIRHAQIEVERENYRHAIKLLEAAQKIEKRSYITDYLKQLRHHFL
jgi:tetratricopeptide (TPR) repeat protein